MNYSRNCVHSRNPVGQRHGRMRWVLLAIAIAVHGAAVSRHGHGQFDVTSLTLSSTMTNERLEVADGTAGWNQGRDIRHRWWNGPPSWAPSPEDMNRWQYWRNEYEQPFQNESALQVLADSEDVYGQRWQSGVAQGFKLVVQQVYSPFVNVTLPFPDLVPEDHHVFRIGELVHSAICWGGRGPTQTRRP